jgi:UPF0755 protein
MSLSHSSKIWITLAIVGIVGILWLAYFSFQLAPVTEFADIAGGTPVPVSTGVAPIVIEQGDGFKQIASLLMDAHVIRSASAFKLYALLSGSAHQLKPGLYTMSPASSTPALVRLLVAGPAKEISVLIPEGATVADIDTTLARYGVLKRGELTKQRVADFYDEYPFLRGARSFEGFLFPDTYRFYFASDPVAVLSTLLKNYAARVGPMIADGATINWDSIPITRRGIFNSLEITTIASLIEKEVPDTQERKIVADIMYRRLKMSMPLQIDATVDYAKVHGDRYDTYQFYGLPPGPISNPGLDAIDAALNPRPSQYLYYLSDPKTGKTIFAKTFEEHKANKLKYLP